MAEVWAAQLLAPGGFCKPMVIKRVLPELAENPTFLKMLMTEARVAARLSHANICAVFELGDVDGEYYIAMEYLRGTSLSGLLRSGGAVSPEVAVAIVAQACEGLHYAHEQRDTSGNLLGLVHRDVSPHNLFVTVDGIVKVLDFGIAKVDDGFSERTEEGKVKGKLTYMSPEQLAALPLDRRSDVWSLAVVLWELIAGRRLFGGGGPAAAVDGIRNARVPSLATVGVPAPRLDHVLARALRADRDDRIATAAELRRALLEAIAPMPPASPEDIAYLVWERCGAEVRANDRRFEEDYSGLEVIDESSSVRRLPLRAEETQPSVPSLAKFGLSGDTASAAIPTAEDWGPGLRPMSETMAPVDTCPEVRLPDRPSSVDTDGFQAVPDLRSGRRGLLIGLVLGLAAFAGAAVVVIGQRRDAGTQVAAPKAGSAPEAPVPAPAEPPVTVDVAPAQVEPPVRVAPAETEPKAAAPPERTPERTTDRAAPSPAPERRVRKPARSGPRVASTPPPRPDPVPAKPGKLTIDANPWATIYVDGKKVGVTPVIGYSLPAGEHTVKAVAEDGKSRTLRIEVEPGGTVRRRVEW